MNHVLSVWLIIARCNEFCTLFNRFQSYKQDGRIVLNSCVQCTVNYTAGCIGKGKSFLGSGSRGSDLRNPIYLGQRIRTAEPISLSLSSHSSPIRKGHPSTAGLTERHFQSPAEQFRIRTHNLMHFNQAFLIIWDCASEIK